MESRAHTPNALRAIKGIGAGAYAAVPALTKLLEEEPNLGVIEALMAIGPKAKPALPALQESLQGANPLVRVLASAAIAIIGGDYDAVVSVLVQELNNPANPAVHWHIQSTPNRVFGGIGFNHRQTAAWFLGELGPPARDAVPELVQALRSQDPWLNVLAARALWRVSRDSRAILPLLIEALDVRDEHRFVLAVQALGEMESEAKPALPKLLRARAQSLPLRIEIDRTIRRIDPP
jgi:HEAT repeat protein